MGIDGIRFFYLSKEHYHQWFYVEPLLIVHQQWFIGKTVVDRELSTTVPRRTVVDTWPSKLGTRLPLSWQNFVSLACYHRRTVKEGTGAHAAAAGTPSPSPCRDPFTTAAAPCWDLFDTTVAAPSSSPLSERHWPHPAMLHRLPRVDGRWPPRGPRLLHSFPPLSQHQHLLWPQPGPLPVKQHAPMPQASIWPRLLIGQSFSSI
jgi:hypothetical protein